MRLSIVTTLYLSASHISEFYNRSSVVAKQLVQDDYEIIFVNDGSPDNSLELVVALAEFDKRIVVVDLSRNFGHHKAMMTGLFYATGDQIFLIDCDLEEEPEYLLKFYEALESKKSDVIFGVQERRKGNWFERISGYCFYKLFNALTGVVLTENIATIRLMTKRYVKALLRHKEREIFLAGLWHITGFDQQSFIVQKHSLSKTTYTFKSKISILVNSVTSFSNVPLRAIFYIGAGISAVSLSYIFYLVLHWMFFAKPLSGWTSVMASIWLLGGLIISFIGIVGIYLSKIFSETKKRPYTIVRQVYGKRA